MRVLHLPKWYPNRYDDQEGNFVARHVDAIAAHASAGTELHSAVLFATVARGPLPRLVEVETDVDGLVPTWRYYYRAHITGIAWLDKPLKLLLWLECMRRGLWAIRRHWGGRGPELIHAHVLFRTGVLALWLKWRRGIPYLLTEHWTVFLPTNRWHLNWLRRWLTGWVVRQAGAYTPVSEDLRRAVAQLGGLNSRTVVIPNVVDTDLFCLPPTPAVRQGLLNVAAFNEQAKNLSGLLRTVARLRTQHSGAGLQLRIAGYGPAEAQVYALAAELGLLNDGTVTFLGKLAAAEVAAEMRRAQAFVLFSNYENLPCVLIEAQASGLPAVATRVNGVPELLPPDGTKGLLVTAGDEDDLATAILAVVQAPIGTFNETLLRAEAVARFSYPAVGAAFGRVYRQVLAVK